MQTTMLPAPSHTSLAIYVDPETCGDAIWIGQLHAELLNLYKSVLTENEKAGLEKLENQVRYHKHNRNDINMAIRRVQSPKARTADRTRKAPSDQGNGRMLPPSNIAPFLRRRSAYDIFMGIDVSPYNPVELVEIITSDDYSRIAGMPWNPGQQFYLVTSNQYFQQKALSVSNNTISKMNHLSKNPMHDRKYLFGKNSTACITISMPMTPYRKTLAPAIADDVH